MDAAARHVAGGPICPCDRWPALLWRRASDSRTLPHSFRPGAVDDFRRAADAGGPWCSVPGPAPGREPGVGPASGRSGRAVAGPRLADEPDRSSYHRHCPGRLPDLPQLGQAQALVPRSVGPDQGGLFRWHRRRGQADPQLVATGAVLQGICRRDEVVRHRPAEELHRLRR